jgi:uncharacterized protein YjdB
MNKKRFLSLALAFAIIFTAVTAGFPLQSKAYDGWLSVVQKASLNTDYGKLLQDVDNYSYGTLFNNNNNEYWFQVFEVNISQSTTLHILFDTRAQQDQGRLDFGVSGSNWENFHSKENYSPATGIYSEDCYCDVTPGTIYIMVYKDGSSWMDKTTLSERIPQNSCSFKFEARSASTETISNLGKTTVSLDRKNLKIEQYKSQQLYATVEPNQSVTWSSSNSDVASVSTSGKVTAQSVGTATITAWSSDNRATASCNVTVVKPAIITKVKNTKPVINKNSSTRSSITLKLRSGSFVKGQKFQIQYKRKGASKWSLLADKGASSLIVKNLRRNTNYQLRVREYVKLKDAYYYGKWSKTVTVKTMK